MPYCQDMDAIIKNAILDDARTVILIDTSTGSLPVWGRFTHRYDAFKESPIWPFFDETFRTLAKSSATDIFTVSELPMLGYLGRWKITIVTRENATEISLRDGENRPFGDYFGVES